LVLVLLGFLFLTVRRPQRVTQGVSSAASDVDKRHEQDAARQSDDADTEPRGDLLKWQKKALKALDKTGSAVCSFESDEMPSAARGMIERGLAAIKSGDEVKILFAVASEWRDYP